MSSTNRGRDRNASDHYPTPAWCVDRLLEAVAIPAPLGQLWLEPCAGEGAIIRAVHRHDPAIRWHACDVRPECLEPLERLADDVIICDVLEAAVVPSRRYVVALSNPPFALAREFAIFGRAVANHCILLLRLNFLGGASRAAWLRSDPPDVYVLPQRPSFANKCATRGSDCGLLPPDVFECPCGAPAAPHTDSTEYAWFHWHDEARGIVRVLDLTPAAERSRRPSTNPLDAL